jgi:hypothetical protein
MGLNAVLASGPMKSVPDITPIDAGPAFAECEPFSAPVERAREFS